MGLLLTCACTPFEGYSAAPEDSGTQSSSRAVTTADGGMDGSTEGGLDGGDDAGPDGGDLDAGCESVRFPQRPSFAAHAGLIDFTVAAREYDLGEEVDDGVPRVASIGFDLDNECTDEAGPKACMIAPGVPRIDQTDAPGGLDNAYGALLYKVKATGGVASTSNANGGIDSGFLSIGIRVRNYNGLSVDEQVDVSVYAVSTIENAATQTMGTPPIWNGLDEWRVVDTELEPASDGSLSVDRPKYRDEHAYVINGRIVAQLSQVRASIFILSQAVITADLVRNDDGSFSLLSGTLAGRVSVDELLAATELRKNPSTGADFCIGTPGYAEMKEGLCSMADISYAGPDDGSQICDALSWAFRFNALPVQIVGIARTDEIPEETHCTPETSTKNDSCSTQSD